MIHKPIRDISKRFQIVLYHLDKICEDCHVWVNALDKLLRLRVYGRDIVIEHNILRQVRTYPADQSPLRIVIE